MRKIRVDGLELAYVERGDGDETVVLSPSYLVDHRHFEAQIEALSARYRVIAYDHREHGESGRTPGAYDIYDLTADAKELIERTGAVPCHFVGLSTGGFVGLRLALRHPELLRSLVLMGTSAELEPRLKRVEYEVMFWVLRAFGFDPLLGIVMRLMFAPATLRDPGRREEVELWRRRVQANDPAALIRFGHAIFGRDSVAGQLAAITTPTLVLVGENDRPQPPERARRIAAGIPGARLEIVPGAGHLSTIDAPEAVSELVSGFLAAH